MGCKSGWMIHHFTRCSQMLCEFLEPHKYSGKEWVQSIRLNYRVELPVDRSMWSNVCPKVWSRMCNFSMGDGNNTIQMVKPGTGHN